MIAIRLIAISSLAIVLLAGVEASTAEPSPTTYPLGDLTWTLESVPGQAPLFGVLMVTYKNNLNTTLEGMVYAVVHNSAGQSLAYDTTTLNMTAGQIGTAYVVVKFGVPRFGTYVISVFATSFSGVAIANSSWVTYTL
jgi:hypothetical protein